MKNLYTLLSTAMLLVGAFSFAQIGVVPVNNSDDLADVLIGDASGITIISTNLIGADGSCGTFSGGDFGFEEGILLTSGSVDNAVGPNTSGSITTNNGTLGDAALDVLAAPFTTNDAAILEIVFVPDGDILDFTYVFGSDEYNEYVCSSFNDVFGFFLSGGAYSDENIALIPGTDPPIPVAINNVNNGSVGSSGSEDNCDDDQLANSAYFVDNTDGLTVEYDGYTTPLNATLAVEPGTEYTLRLAIADAGDSAFDSGVFIQAGSVISAVCDAGDIEIVDLGSLEICIDDLMPVYDLSNNGDGTNDEYVYVLTDADLNILQIADGFIETDDWTSGEYQLWGLSYSGNIEGLMVGANAGELDSPGCYELSSQLELSILEDCDVEYDCEELMANFGDECDDGDDMTENDMLNENCECVGEMLLFDCPDMMMNIGDACDLGGVPGVIMEGCECVPNQVNEGCESYALFLSDNVDGMSHIYRVDVSGSTGTMTWLKSFDYSTHIAYDQEEDLLYVVRSENGSFRTLDVSVVDGVASPEIATEMPLGSSVAVGMSPDGELIVGSQDSQELSIVHKDDGSLSYYADAAIQGGDFVIGNDGTPILATRNGGVLYAIFPGFMNMLIGTSSDLVTGLAVLESGDLLFSEFGSTSLTGRAMDGTDNGMSVDLMLDGSPFTTSNGDLAYGCMDPEPVFEGCEDFMTYYVNHGPGVSGSDLYKVDFVGNEAVLTHELNVNYEVHMGMNAEEGVVYLVNANGNFIEFFDISTSTVNGNLPIVGNINQLYAVVYNPADELLYVGDSGDDEIYTVDLTTGIATFYADAPVQGGDLVLQEGILYLAKRSTNDLFTVVMDADGVPDGTSEATLIGSLPDETNGMAAANNSTSLICASYGTSTFTEISNVDGSLIQEYLVTLGGDPFPIRHGDMASGCAVGEGGVDECDYKLYYTHQPEGGSYSLNSVVLNGDGTATVTELLAGLPSAHIALSPDGDLVYIVGGGNLDVYEVSSGLIITTVPIVDVSGAGLSGFPAAVCGDDGTIYIAGGGDNVYTLALDGTATEIASNVGVSGGDLIIAAGDLWLINRTTNTFINITDPGNDFVVPVTEINGAAVLENGNVLVADGNGDGLFKEIDLNTLDVAETYETGLELFNGDLAGRCLSADPLIEEGSCYAEEVVERIAGTTIGGGDIADNRNDENQALGEPERTDELVFLSFGYDGGIILGFDGAVPNEDGDDIEVVETTFGDQDCDSYPEYADVYVSMDGDNYLFAKTVCKSDGFVDISDAGDMDYIMYVKIMNNNDLSTTGDGYDLDGVVALHNCEDEPNDGEGENEGPAIVMENGDKLSSFPNPVTEQSTIQFTTQSQGRALLEVYDMNGRVVTSLLNQEVAANTPYQFNFDVSNLTNGIYIYKLTTVSGVSINKIIVNK